MAMRMKTYRPEELKSPLGIVAGGGQFPILCARAARKLGLKVVAVGFNGETDPLLENEVDLLHWLYIGQLERLIKVLKKAGTRQVLFQGTITKKRIFRDVRPDLRALILWSKIRRRLDDNILRAIASELEAEGLEVIPSTTLLPDLVAPKGVLTKRSPSKDQWQDIHFGLELAKKIGELDIGQCIVVKDRTVLAVEAIEGTDSTIKRGGELGGKDTVVVKVCKPNQDIRFDLPSVGLKTIETMEKVKAKVLAVEAGKTLIFDRDKVIELANSLGIIIVAQ